MKKRKAIGLTPRSEVVTVRFEPRLKYLVELHSRVHLRPMAGFIVFAVDRYLSGSDIKLDKTELSICGLEDELWHVDPMVRLIRLAKLRPQLMTTEEQKQLEALLSLCNFNLGKFETDILPMVRGKWEEFVKAFELNQVQQWFFDLKEKK